MLGILPKKCPYATTIYNTKDYKEVLTSKLHARREEQLTGSWNNTVLMNIKLATHKCVAITDVRIARSFNDTQSFRQSTWAFASRRIYAQYIWFTEALNRMGME